MSAGRALTGQAGGADAPEPQGVSALPGAHPSRMRGDKFSPNLAKWVAKNDKRPLPLLDMYLDHEGVHFLGRLDDDGWFIGSRFRTILNDGARAMVFAHPPGKSLTPVADFWQRYSVDGRCAYDIDHRIHFIGDETRWDTHGDERSCLWCGKHKQRLHRWSETVEHAAWRAAA